MKFSFHVLPIVLLPVCKNFCALAVEFTIGEFAFIGAAIGVGECALAVELAIAEAAHIKHAAGGGQGTLSVQVALGPVAGQGVAVGPGQGALAMEFVAFEKAVVTAAIRDRKSTRLNSSHVRISYAVFCLKKKKSGVSTS